MSKHPRVYPPEFRHKALELMRAGKSAQAVATEFSVSRQTLINWIKQDQVNGGSRAGLSTAEREELAKLRRENKQLRIEREILSKAAAWFARETDAIPSKSSNS
jgi:transposase